MSVFYRSALPDLDGRLATGYATADEYLADLHVLAVQRIARAQLALRHLGAPTATRKVDDELAACEARLAEIARWQEARLAASTADVPITELVVRCGLATVDLHVLGLLLAVELDGTLLAPLGTPPPPGVDASTLHAAIGDLAIPRAEWLRAHLGATAPLVANGLVRFEEVPGIPLSRRPVTVASPVLHKVTGLAHGDELRDGVVRACPPYATHPRADELAPLMREAGGIALWIYGSGDRLALAAAVAAADRREAVRVDALALAHELTPRQRAALVATIALEQRLDDRVVILELDQPTDAAIQAARALVARLAGPCILCSAAEHAALAALAAGAHHFTFPRLDAAGRHAEWRRRLAVYGSALPDVAVKPLASDFPLDAAEIEDVVRSVARGGPITADRLRASALVRQAARLGRLAQFVPHSFTIDDLVLPAEELDRLVEIVARQRFRDQVLERWNMASKVPYGTGTAALFAGPPGTGKTMAASVIAKVLERELYRVDLSRVVDKYIGETEKNLGAIFDAAVDANAILLFDEADSLFAKRTTVSSSHDRYANLETNYLLQRIEEHPGLSILTTNNAQSIDPAFARRLQFRMEFPFPDAAARAEIWKRCFSPEVPRRDDVDFRWLGGAFEISGANIKSAVLRAAFLAAQRDAPVSTRMLAEAAVREFENAGKLPPAFTLPARH